MSSRVLYLFFGATIRGACAETAIGRAASVRAITATAKRLKYRFPIKTSDVAVPAGEARGPKGGVLMMTNTQAVRLEIKSHCRVTRVLRTVAYRRAAPQS